MALDRVYAQLVKKGTDFFGRGLDLFLRWKGLIGAVGGPFTIDPPTTTVSKGVVFDGGDVTEQTSPNMSVRVYGTKCIAESGDFGYSEVAANLDVAINAADGDDPRHDIIVVTNEGAFAVRSGTPASSPTDPDLTSGDVVLARVLVGDGVTSIVNANITDLRKTKWINGAFIKTGTIPASASAVRYQPLDTTTLGSSNVFNLDVPCAVDFESEALIFVGAVPLKYKSSPASNDEFHFINDNSQLEIGGANLLIGLEISGRYAYLL